MKIANSGGRAVLVVDDEVADIEKVSGGQFGPDPMQMFERWDDFVEMARGVTTGTALLAPAELRCPVPAPRQVFAVGLNYRDHAEESDMAVPEIPATFTKFPASLTGPFDEVPIVGTTTDWEVELVVVIGARADRVGEADAWSHVAGLTVGQDISDRHLQFAAAGQFSLGKSRRGYGPIGPWIVTPDELPDRDNLALGCAIDGETVQDARTDDMIWNVAQLIAELSGILPLLPGDIIFTGTPGGIGATRKPPRFLTAGQTLESWIEGIGTIRNPLVSDR